MQISVIIPVYNAEDFVTLAVESALAQPETGEVILIEDGSPDNSLTICQELEEKYNKVRLLRHPHGRNKGAAASRNLGMKSWRRYVLITAARSTCTAFLAALSVLATPRSSESKITAPVLPAVLAEIFAMA